MNFGKNISHFRAPDLHPRLPRITAQGRETTAYHPEENPKRCQHRAMLLAVLWQGAIDYHLAKNKLRVKKVKTEADYWNLEKWDRVIVDDGKSAWEWFTGEPNPRSKGAYTFKEICDYFKVNPAKLWRQIKKTPKVGEMLGVLKVAESMQL